MLPATGLTLWLHYGPGFYRCPASGPRGKSDTPQNDGERNPAGIEFARGLRAAIRAINPRITLYTCRCNNIILLSSCTGAGTAEYLNLYIIIGVGLSILHAFRFFAAVGGVPIVIIPVRRVWSTERCWFYLVLFLLFFFFTLFIQRNKKKKKKYKYPVPEARPDRTAAAGHSVLKTTTTTTYCLPPSCV